MQQSIADTNNVIFSYLYSTFSSEHMEKERDKEKNQSSMKHLHLYLDIQMSNTLKFDDAHRIIDAFEQKIKNEIHFINQITTHIETEIDIDSSLG